ncbi:hypothetical protein SBOR_8451 [Sclerotinia borealis F-4128]|uniref:2EXR domain-containing protein n=1 Tax=Sclerotinia borealis (strain F-4128) TaxID=1432307 RepID=W9C8H2_SCLBF|nr:hypothetical protein SBOR_8451 [Sclerotinia borealis F-4128]
MRSLTPWEYLMAKRRFTLYNDLPIEIKGLIWKFTLEPRLVEVWPKYGKYNGFYSRTPLPSAMTACRDSRAFVLRLYPKLFGGPMVEARVRFNFNIDTLYLDWKIQDRLAALLLSITKEEAGKFRYLAIDGHITWGRASYSSFQLDVFHLQRHHYLRHDVYVNHRDVRLGEEEDYLLLRAVFYMSRLEFLTIVYDAWRIDRDGHYVKRDEFADLTIFYPEDYHELFPGPPDDALEDYREVIFRMWDMYTSHPRTLYKIMYDGFHHRIRDIECQFRWRFPKSFPEFAETGGDRQFLIPPEK